MRVVKSSEIKSTIIRELIEWYEGAIIDGGPPKRSDFKPYRFSPGLIRRIFLAEVEHEPFRVRFRAAGDLVEESFGLPLSGKYIDELQIAQRGDLLDWYQSLIGVERPIFSQDIYSIDGDEIPYEGALFPLDSDHSDKSYFVGAEDFADLPSWRSSVRNRHYGPPQDIKI